MCFAEFISHSFSIPELQFLFQNVLPDLTGKLVIDVGSRLGAVLYGVNCGRFLSRCLNSLSNVVIKIRILIEIILHIINWANWPRSQDQSFDYQLRSFLYVIVKTWFMLLGFSDETSCNLWSIHMCFPHQGYLYSAAAQLVGIEINSEFVKLQTMAVEKYGFSDRIQV